MPDISAPVTFDSASLILITTKKSQPAFSYKSWGDEDLEPIRQIARSYYRTIQNAKCAFCKKDMSLESALNCHVEHIVPKSLHEDFMFLPKNLCVICADCNVIKRDQETIKAIPETLKKAPHRIQYPRSSSAFLIVHPHFDNYEEHILEINGYYLDLSPKGHFTIGACRLNRRLHEFGWEEPLMSEEKLRQTMNDFLSGNDFVAKFQALHRLKKLLALL